MIQFDPVLHAYSRRGVPYISATQLIAMYKDKFDIAKESIGMADRHGMTPEYWQEKWKQESRAGAEAGTRFHDEQEAMTLSNGFELREGHKHRIRNANLIALVEPDYMNWPDGVYTELLLWNHRYRLAGKADKVIISTDLLTGRRTADIDDYKTNKRIRYSGYNAGGTMESKKMKYPIQDLDDCEWVHYAIQLSLYQFMLDEMGFEPGNRRMLYHPPLPPDLSDDPYARSPDATIYDLPYLYEAVIAIADDWCSRCPQ